MSLLSKESKISAYRPGEWVGTLARVAAENGHPVSLYIKNPESLKRFREDHVVDRLPGIKMPPNVTASSDLEEVLNGAEGLIFGPPSKHYRRSAEEVMPWMSTRTRLLSVTKGLEPGTSMRMSQVLFDVAPSLEFRSAFLSGPNLAKEVGRRIETGTVIASNDADLEVARHFKQVLSNSKLKVLLNPDVIGVELGGALKNPYSIAAGIEAGLAGRRGISANRHSLLFVSSLAEMITIGEALGADPITFAGYSGVGDLELGFKGVTRNFRVGIELAKRKTRMEILALGFLAEGLTTLPPLYELVNKLGIEAPILKALYGVVFEELRITEAIKQFMNMDVQDEYLGTRSIKFYLGRLGLRIKQTLPFIQ